MGTLSATIPLFIEFLDEFVFGAREAAWPVIRGDLALTYAQVGLLISLPSLVSSVVEPFIGILGDTWNRRALILGGGLVFSLSLAVVAISQDFFALLVAFALLYPASGAFVSLSQATLMDTDPSRHAQNMARWTLAGSVGAVVGPAALGGAIMLDMGWRGLFLIFATLSLILLVTIRKSSRFVARQQAQGIGFWNGVVDALRALRKREVLRWLALLQFSDLMTDILLGFLALYLVDAVGVTPAGAGVGVAVWTGAGLLGGLLLVPLIERVRGLVYLRISAAVELVLFVLFLAVPILWIKIVLLGFVGLFSAGWYSIPQARLYSSMPGQSGTVMTLGNLSGLIGGLIPLALGVIAEQWGLEMAMVLLCAGPIALLVGLPGREPAHA